MQIHNTWLFSLEDIDIGTKNRKKSDKLENSVNIQRCPIVGIIVLDNLE